MILMKNFHLEIKASLMFFSVFFNFVTLHVTFLLALAHVKLLSKTFIQISLQICNKYRTYGTACSQFHQHFMCAFLYESELCSFYLITVWLCDFLVKWYWWKKLAKMLMKLTSGIQNWQKKLKKCSSNQNIFTNLTWLSWLKVKLTIKVIKSDKK